MVLMVIFTGLFVVINFQINIEEKRRIRDINTKGNHLVSLIAMNPISSFKGDQKYFLRTLMESSTREDLAYCYIIDRSGTPALSFALPQSSSAVHNYIETTTARATEFALPPYEINDANIWIYEFAKPIFENREQAGTVKIGLTLHPPSIFTKERISLMGMLFFFICAAIILVYFGIIETLKPFNKIFSTQVSRSRKSHQHFNYGKFLKVGGIRGMMQEFQTSLIQLNKRLKIIERNNKGLASQVGVVRYEKNQIMNILNTIKYGVVIIDVQGDVVQINDYLLKIIGRKREDMIDQPFEDVFPYPTLIHFISQQENIEQLRPAADIELSLSENPESDIFSITCTPLSGEDDQILGNLISFSNISFHKAAEKNTIAFVAHLSHELMTPLTTIQSYSEMLMDGEVEGAATQKEFYNTINKETRRLSRLIKDLLNLSRIEMGDLALAKDIIKTQALFEDCLVAVEGSAKKKEISIEKHVPDNFPTFVGDKELLKGALINILGNAVKYTPEKGMIEFGMRLENDMITFDISDTGYGMSPEDLDRIFIKFYRSSNPDVVGKQGTGLGLSIADEIISLHGGRIEVQSTLGRGTYFIVSIPAEEYYIDQ